MTNQVKVTANDAIELLKAVLSPIEWDVFEYMLLRNKLAHRPVDIAMVVKKETFQVCILLAQLRQMELVIQDEHGHWRVNQ